MCRNSISKAKLLNQTSSEQWVSSIKKSKQMKTTNKQTKHWTSADSGLKEVLDKFCQLPIVEPDSNWEIIPGTKVFIYHDELGKQRVIDYTVPTGKRGEIMWHQESFRIGESSIRKSDCSFFIAEGCKKDLENGLKVLACVEQYGRVFYLGPVSF